MHFSGTYRNTYIQRYTISSIKFNHPTFDSPDCFRDQTRSWSDVSREYRYGFNGKEKDFETANDDFPIAIGTGARIYDGRLGRWYAIDAKIKQFVSNSPYSAMVCSPIIFSDIKGEYVYVSNNFKSSSYYTVLTNLMNIGDNSFVSSYMCKFTNSDQMNLHFKYNQYTEEPKSKASGFAEGGGSNEVTITFLFYAHDSRKRIFSKWGDFVGGIN